MGRLNLTALRVRKRAILNHKTGRTSQRPVWLDITGDIPPAQILTRQQPTPQPLIKTRQRTHTDPETGETIILPSTSSSSFGKSNKTKNRRLFLPNPIQYEEDSLRQRFYRDHPWELARPRVVVEGSGNQHATTNFAHGLQQPGLPLNGESVVQRQLYLLRTIPDITENQTYDIARKEFYVLRRKEEIAIRVQREEAGHNGIEPERGPIQRALDREDVEYDGWEKWAREQVGLAMQRDAGFAGVQLPQETDAMEGVTAFEGAKGGARISDTVFANEEARGASRAAREAGRSNNTFAI